MKRVSLSSMIACLFILMCASQAAAQTAGPPKVMLFEREEIRPGKLAEHEREANNFARLLAHATTAKEPAYVRFGMVPIAGNANEVLYMYSFNSLEQWAQSQRDIDRWMSRPGPMKAFFDRTSGPPRTGEDLHTSVRSMVGVLQPSMSYKPKQNISKARYFSMTTIRVKPGHYGDFMKLAGMYVDAVSRMKGDPHFAAFEIVGGAPDGTFVFLSSMEALSEMDTSMANSSEFPKAMGDKLDDFEKLSAEAIESIVTNIYAINPRISNPPAEFVAADSGFWSQEMPVAPAATEASTRPAPRKRQR